MKPRCVRNSAFPLIGLLICVCAASLCLLAWPRKDRADGGAPAVHAKIRIRSRAQSKPQHVEVGDVQESQRGAGEIDAALAHENVSGSLTHIEEPSNICSSFAPVNYSSAPTKDERGLLRFVSALHTVIPPSTLFTPFLRNPCWFMHLSDPHQVRQELETASEFTDTEASFVLGEAMHSRVQQMVCLPKIFFMGFPRCGSTQIYKMLIAHPDVVSGWTKEPHWWTKHSFNERFPHNILSILQYITYFSTAAEQILMNPKAMAIDASQSTIWDARGLNNICILPTIISSIVPDARYIVAMREPGSRLFSDFKYLAHRLQWPESGQSSISGLFHNHLEKEIHKFTECMRDDPIEKCTHLSTVNTRVRLGISLYYVHVAKWLNTIPIDQFIFVRTEDLSNSPESVLGDLWAFLELRPQQEGVSDDVGGEANTNKMEVDMWPSTRELLTDFFRPFNQKLSSLLKDRGFLWED